MTEPQPISDAQLARIRASRQLMVERARRKGFGKQLTYLIHSAIVFPIVWLLQLMPVDRASDMGGWLGRNVLGRLLNFRKLYRTVRVPFPQLADAEIDTMLVEMSDNIVRVLAETVHLRAFSGPDNSRVRVRGREHLDAARAGGKGVLVLTGHFANWEMSEVALRNLRLDGAVVVQHPTNPHVVEWLARQRLAVGLSEQVGAGEGVFQTLRKRLRDGSVVLMLCDQRVGNGIKVPFFGLETITNYIPARLAGSLGIAVVPMSIRRLEGANFEVEFLPPLWFEASGDRQADELAFMTRVNTFYEAEVLGAPGQWLWGHPRWDDVFLDLKPKRERKAP